jgi:phosphoribosylformylglycinamidine synthase I
MAAPRALILSGYGINCEDESAHALDHCGSEIKIMHINDLIDEPKTLNDYQILLIPGGFSYGDDTGSGNAYARKLANHLQDAIAEFIKRDTLTLGICNGCQILARLGVVPGLELTAKGHHVGVVHNASNRYQCRWVHVETANDHNIWLKGISRMYIPVAHGEGNMVMRADTLDLLQSEGLIAQRYVMPDGKAAKGAFPHNPNGSMDDIAAISDTTGRVLAMMPHPERGMFFTQRDDWPRLKAQHQRAGKTLPMEADGMAIFHNAVRYFA